MNHTFDKYDSYLSMKPRFSRDSLAKITRKNYLFLTRLKNLFLTVLTDKDGTKMGSGLNLKNQKF